METLDQVPRRYRPLYQACQIGRATPLQAVKAMCLQCVGWTREDVKTCSDESCPLWRLRERALRRTMSLDQIA